ncbi:MAG TPA: hypothetical protein VGS78_02635 [Candidatus Sulfotelmatobacter sp.]|nr:hypothetical protein [Candidatus Sulfotelmatobacter sp.]
MENLLRSLFLASDPGRSVSGLSNQAWDILKRIKTVTWQKLAEAITEAERLRAGTKQAQTTPAEQNEKATLPPT